ncbi:hypothetical protein ACFWF9_37215, partial [Streptomyces roseolus]|uniref:hypothetical protein n=1 Tax=Streptomyces roseolus TaxID=67358 RepID=UPI00365DEDD9
MRDQRVSAVWRHEHVPVTCSEAVRMAAAGPTAASPGSIERIVAAVLIGTTVEWLSRLREGAYR